MTTAAFTRTFADALDEMRANARTVKVNFDEIDDMTLARTFEPIMVDDPPDGTCDCGKQNLPPVHLPHGA